MKNKIIFALIVLGVTSLTSQIILMREITANFFGNELAIGIILALWMLGIGSGSLAAVKLNKKFDSAQLANGLLSLTCFFAVIPLVIVRTARPILGIPHYELVNLGFFSLVTFIAVMPLAFILGATFVSLVTALSKSLKKAESSIGYSYATEAVGSFLAGIIFTYLLINHLTHIEIINLLIILNFASSLVLKGLNQKTHLSVGISVLLLILAANFFIHKQEQLRFYKESLVAQKNSIYGNIAITKKGAQFCVYSNGSLLFTTEDTQANEETTHLVMLESANPQEILLVGGGVNGNLKEILKHSPKNIDYLEMDPLLIRQCVKNIPALDKKSLFDSRVKIRILDARYFIKLTDKKYDVIIVNVPDPLNIQTNRFFSQEFFKQAARHLQDKGIFSITVSSKEDYLSKEIAAYNSCVYKTLKSVFKETELLPSFKLILLGAKEKGVLTLEPSVLKQRFAHRKLKNEFFTPFHIDSRLGKDKNRIEYIRQTLEKYLATTQINHDFTAPAFFAGLKMWLKETTNVKYLPTKNGLLLVALITLLVFLAVLIYSRKRILEAVIFTTGAVGISSEFAILLAFQSIYGFLYYRMGIIIASFMLGLALGGYFMTFLGSLKNPLQKLKWLELSLLVYIILLLLILALIKQSGLFIFQAVLIILAAGLGFLVGLEFPLASRISLHKHTSIVSNAGRFYACDIFGSALGGFFSSLVLFPALGIYGLLLFLAAVKFATFILLPKKPQQ